MAAADRILRQALAAANRSSSQEWGRPGLTDFCMINTDLCMRTTLDLDDALLAEAKRRAAAKGTTLTAFVEHALAAALAGRDESGPPYRLAWKTHRGSSPPSVDVADRDHLIDVMEGRR
jgi:hypothetical protein